MNRIQKTIHFRKSRRAVGSALILVLWLVMLMTMVVTVTARISHLDTYTSQYSIERIRCQWAARAGAETALALLLTDEKDTDTLQDIWADNPDELEDIELEGCRFTTQVIDESGKLNVNTATSDHFYQLPDASPEIVDSLLDWIDRDQEMRLAGAELGYYLNLPNGYTCRDGQVESIRELLLVREIDEFLFYGPGENSTWTENEGWFHYLSCQSAQLNRDSQGRRRVNMNTARRGQLRRLSLNNDQITFILNNREFDGLLELTQANDNNQNNSNQNNNVQTNSSNSSRPSSPLGSSGNSRSLSNSNSSNSNRNNSSSNQNDNEGKPLDWNTLLKIADRITLENRNMVSGKINLNTAGEKVLMALFDGQREAADGIIAYRQNRDYGIESFEELQRIEGVSQSQLKKVIDLITLRSSVYRIESVGISQATGQQILLDIVVNRDKTNHKILYWRQQRDELQTKTDIL